MANLVAIAYDDMDQAESVMRSIGELVKEHSLTLEDAVIVEHKENGKLKLHQPSLTGIGAASGALWGGVIGLLFLVPVSAWPWARQPVRPAARRATMALTTTS